MGSNCAVDGTSPSSFPITAIFCVSVLRFAFPPSPAITPIILRPAPRPHYVPRRQLDRVCQMPNLL